jgi:DNA invertase Pin-like site-specific DNA recombinase
MEQQQGLINAGVYCRLSQDDGQAGDSASIQTQKLMLEKHCKEQGYLIHDFYVDDGYSGSNFNRPDFIRMLGDVEDGKINLVITKDLSRLGRDYIQTGYYTEIYFPDKRVRYIALHDGVDTAKADNDIAPFKNILNDMYARDISRKVKAAKRQRALSGMFIASQTPYGYKQHPDNKNKLVIDPEAAAVVKEIFALAVEGKGYSVIAKILGARGILKPSAYKRAHGDTRFERYATGTGEACDSKWCFSTVQLIMKDRVYVGDMENHKKEILNHKTKKCVGVAKSDRIVVENTHEPIVSREDFERVQELMKARHTPPHLHRDNIFRSILFCSECGRRMVLGSQAMRMHGTTVTRTFYRCMNRFINPDRCRHHNRIYYESLYERVQGSVRNVFVSMKGGSYAHILEKADPCKSGQAEAERQKIEKRLAALSKIIRRLYEDYAADTLDGDNYQSLLRDYRVEQNALNERLALLNKASTAAADREANLKRLKSVVAAYADCDELTAEMLNSLIERIEVKHAETVAGVKKQEINIVYRFIGTPL